MRMRLCLVLVILGFYVITMKENQRKCCKCGSSVAKDPTVKLYRFPKPGPRNILRCELWAKFLAPEGSWASQDLQNKMFSEHNMICSNHFEEKCFINIAEKKLFLDAVPTIEIPEMNVAHGENVTRNVKPNLSMASTILKESQNVMNVSADGENVLGDITNLTVASTSRQTTTTKESQDVMKISADSKNINNLSVASTSRQENTVEESQNVACAAPAAKNRRLYTQCRKYMKKICRLKSSIKKMKVKNALNILKDDQSIEKLSQKLTPAFALLLQGQIRNFNRRPKGHRWTEAEKITALRIYKRSPTCYRLLRRLFSLPAPSTLKKILSRFQLTAGINKKIFFLLKRFSSTLKKEDNHFVLMFDEISIRKNILYNVKEDHIEGFQDHGNHGRTSEAATHALVFMIAGIRKPVKQPIAFYISGSHVTADRLSIIIKEVVLECLQAGINIQSLVCDMDGVNVRAYKILGATETKPQINIHNKDIIVMFDTPHLLKCFRNLFLKYDVKCPMDIDSPVETMGIAKWSHIEAFYEVDSVDSVFVYAPGLTTSHLQPNSKQKMKVSLATEVLSHSVASGMYGRIAAGTLTSGALITASVISNMDKLFDLVNSSTPDLNRSKPYATNISDSSPHKNFFKKMKNFFQKVSFVNCKRDPPSRVGWIWTLTAIEKLWLALRSTEIKSVSTRRLQQDPLENFFSVVRSNCGSNTNPTVGQFQAAIKTSMLAKLPIIAGNCEKDNNEIILENFKTLISPVLENPIDKDQSITYETIEEFESIEIDTTNNDLTATAYVCGFIIKNRDQNCAVCREILNASEEEDIHLFMSFKEYSDTHKRLKYASRPFVQNVDQCARLINDYLTTNAYESKLKQKIFELVKGRVSFNYLNKCSDHATENVNHIIKCVFHIVVKRFCILKNRNYVELANKIALKNKINILKHV